MRDFQTKRLPPEPETLAPDGAKVRLLATLAGGSFAHFELPAGAVSRAVQHRSVEEIWHVVGGRGRIWRRSHRREEIVAIEAGDSLTIPLGVAFQYQAAADAPLVFVAITMPPWPGPDEAIFVDGPWPPRVPD